MRRMTTGTRQLLAVVGAMALVVATLPGGGRAQGGGAVTVAVAPSTDMALLIVAVKKVAGATLSWGEARKGGGFASSPTIIGRQVQPEPKRLGDLLAQGAVSERAHGR